MTFLGQQAESLPARGTKVSLYGGLLASRAGSRRLEQAGRPACSARARRRPACASRPWRPDAGRAGEQGAFWLPWPESSREPPTPWSRPVRPANCYLKWSTGSDNTHYVNPGTELSLSKGVLSDSSVVDEQGDAYPAYPACRLAALAGRPAQAALLALLAEARRAGGEARLGYAGEALVDLLEQPDAGREASRVKRRRAASVRVRVYSARALVDLSEALAQARDACSGSA